MPSRNRFLTLLPFLFLAALSGCRAQEDMRFEKRELVLEGAEKTVTIRAEIARSDAQRSRGLMYRTELSDGEGMLFVFPRDEMLSFWMKNTLVPLSIAYISSEGRILEIHDMEPRSEFPVKSGRSCRYALEVPRGWFSRAGFGVGDRLKTGEL
jgi:uncharacterized membrane protein (UPF0127 family)